jgi:hypothetical protein
VDRVALLLFFAGRGRRSSAADDAGGVIGDDATVTARVAGRSGEPGGSGRWGGVVLLVGYVLAPGDRAAVLSGLLHGDVGHELGRGAVPVVLSGLEEDPVARADLVDRLPSRWQRPMPSVT